MKLIINAEDFGMSQSITDGILYGIEKGFVTSASMMMTCEFTNYAIHKTRDLNLNCVGVHLDLHFGKAVGGFYSTLTDEHYMFLKFGKKKLSIANRKYDKLEVLNEFRMQINRFIQGVGRKPSHIDCHYGLYENTVVKNCLFEIAKEFSLPMRINDDLMQLCKENKIKSANTIFNGFFGRNHEFGVRKETIKHIINKYKNTNYVVDIMTHIGYIDEFTRTNTRYLAREEELFILEDAKKSGYFKNIELINYSQL